MECQRKVILGYDAFSYKTLSRATDGQVLKFLSSKMNPYGRLLLALQQYLQQYSKYFDTVHFVLSYERNWRWSNGTWKGMVKKINDSEIDVGVSTIYMTKEIGEIVDFSYPYELEDYTFIIQKPKYKPHIFGIFQTFSLSVWIAIILALILMPIMSYTILKRKYTLTNNFVHVFAVLMKQNSIIRPSSLVETFLVYSWVVEAMLLCMSFDSVFLSFLSIPPITKIKTLSDLAKAVQSGDYHCISRIQSGIAHYLQASKQEHLRLIGTDIIKNKLSYGQPFVNFERESHKENLAFFIETRFAHVLPGDFFVSEDYFKESMPAMVVRKGFCYKELLDSFVHKMMASGLYFKYLSDDTPLGSIEYKLNSPDSETCKRKLTLTDIAPAFIFLISGYFLSFLIFIVEVWSSKKKNISIKIIPQKKGKKVSD